MPPTGSGAVWFVIPSKHLGAARACPERSRRGSGRAARTVAPCATE